jgi:hypothetical protein
MGLYVLLQGQLYFYVYTILHFNLYLIEFLEIEHLHMKFCGGYLLTTSMTLNLPLPDSGQYHNLLP